MSLNKKAISCNSGATLILVALMFMTLMIVLGITVDGARLYAVQSKAQTASDTALLGAVATRSTTDVTQEMTRLFTANFPAGYLGSVPGDFTITQASNGVGSVYNVTFPITVPTLIMGLFGNNGTTLNILSQVTIGGTQQQIELSLVLDNTGSMSDAIDDSGTQKIDALKTATADLTNIIFGNATTLDNVHVSVVPFDIEVNVGSDLGSKWVQSLYTSQFAQQSALIGGGAGFLANRNSDFLINNLVDVSDAPPMSDDTKFRMPTPNNYYSMPPPYTGISPPQAYTYIKGFLPDVPKSYINADGQWASTFLYCIYPTLARLQFGLNVKSDLINMISTMKASGNTRINVGLMWGWFTLSPKWQGLWDSSKPNLPAQPSPLLSKQMVLMTDGQNTLYNGNAAGTEINDDTTTAQLCEAIKAEGITIYTIGLGTGNEINTNLLKNCASQPAYFFLAPTTADLVKDFQAIADEILFPTIRLSQ